jgi:hypothetical protein
VQRVGIPRPLLKAHRDFHQHLGALGGAGVFTVGRRERCTDFICNTIGWHLAPAILEIESNISHFLGTVYNSY